MTSQRKSLVLAAPYLIIGGAAAYLYYTATRIEYAARSGTLGPDFWPKLILALILAVCAYEVVKLVVLRRHDEATGVLHDLVEDTTPPEDRPAADSAEPHHPWRLVGGIALTAAYVAVLPRLGFFTATVAYVAAFISLGGYRRFGVIALTSVVGTLVMLFFFMKVVYVSLPLGQGPFQQITLWLMQLLGIR